MPLRKLTKLIMLSLLIPITLCLIPSRARAVNVVPAAYQPVLIASLTPGDELTKVGLAANAVGLQFTFSRELNLETLEQGMKEREGRVPFKTLIFVVGSGESGEQVLPPQIRDYCRENNIYIIAVDITGADGIAEPRTPEWVADLATYAKQIIINTGSAKEQVYITHAGKQGIPITVITDCSGELKELIQKIFMLSSDLEGG